MNRGFWDNLKKPIIALAPMDGVTDAAFRYIVDKYGKPDILFTEFTSVEGIVRGATKLLEAFIYHNTETPTVAQIFGSHPDDFYRVAFVIAEMGFDGIDINMGCPDHAVAKKGGGAGLIRTPELAQEIVKSTKQAAEDWANGREITDLGLPISLLEWITQFNKQYDHITTKQLLPVSVKTRIGYDDAVTEEWIQALIDVEPVNISLHGRTLKQMYTGQANWNEIRKAARLVKASGKNITILGNGDIKSLDEAAEKIKRYEVDGVLIGRAAFGNPWVFTHGSTATLQQKFDVALEHCQVFDKLTPEAHFLSMRKHLAWYCKGFEHASETRVKLLQVNNIQDVKSILSTTIPS